MPIITSKFLKHVIALFIFLIASFYLTFPLALHFKDYTPGNVDELYITWILNWDIHTLTTNISNLFDGNIYYPYSYSIAYSDLHLSSAIIGLLPVVLTQEPLTAYTVNLFLSFALLGFTMYLLVYFLTSDFWSSTTSGMIFGFSTYLLPKLGHLQVLTCYWIALSVLCHLLYIKSGKFRYFLLTLFFFYLQFVNSFQPAYFLVFCLITISVYEVVTKRKTLPLFINKRTVTAVIIVLLISLPIIYPYYYTSLSQGYTRDIREAIHTANRPEHFFLNYGRSYIGPILYSLLYKNPGPFLYDGYRGFMSIILTFLVILYSLFKWKKPKPAYFSLFTSIALASYIISLGPAFQLGGKVIKEPFMIPLPYALLYYLAPGFQGFRNSGRWEMYEIFAFCVAIGILLAFLLKTKKILRIVINAIFCAAVLLEFTFPIKYMTVPTSKNIPNVYNFIALTNKNSVIAEFPIYNWNMSPYASDEELRIYYSTYHFRKTINGGGGFSPFPWQKTIEELASSFPNAKAITQLKKLKINYIIVHDTEFDKLFLDNYSILGYSIPNSKMVKTMLSENKSVKYIDTFDNKDSVYKIIY